MRPPRDSDRRTRLAVKRALDVGGAATAAFLLAPVMAWVAVGVALTSGFPVLFRQERPGLRGAPFTIYKFRTMRPPGRGEVFYLTDERRLTRFGRFLRASSLDELPELWNVIRGEMSLVGPRPLLMEYLDQYTPQERRRHDMRPGVTGWAVVNGRNELRFRDRLALDLWYVDHWSLGLDARILAVTVGHVLRRTNATTTEDLALGFPLPGLAQGAMGDGGAGGVDGAAATPTARP
jgi:lipopolysaccharide/colanic/teichoic acid biosynthesis glycosyltransferase